VRRVAWVVGFVALLGSSCSAAGVITTEGPSQTSAEARRDGVVVVLAEFPFTERVEPLAEVPTDGGTWMLARPTRVVLQAAGSDGCLDTDAVDPEEAICVAEYGEVLLVDRAGRIVRAYPMPAAVPTWIAVVSGVVYAGRIGDGALPDSTLVRIDRRTLAAEVLAIQSSIEPGLARR